MKLFDMKRPKRKRNNAIGVEAPSDYEPEKYPYGLRLRLERCQIKQLPGSDKLETGDKIFLTGEGKVISTRIEDRARGGKDHTVEIQIQKLGIDPKKSLKQMDMKAYRKERKK
ncbi:MAG: hypothetical protein DRH93_11645 [Deltaproteobacteria bacterium]|nr:MAG: hypothetical protein DRH93_11645 [Deltaproteobacteria bacterium]